MNSYEKYVKANPDKIKSECERIKKYLNDKYKNNEEFRLKRIEYQRNYRARTKINKPTD